MKYDRMLRRQRRTGERGVALLFALGILSLLIIAVLVFAHRSSVDRKVASAYAGSTEAKGLVQSALNRAVLTLQHNSAKGTAFYSYRSSGADGTDYDWLWKLESPSVSLGTSCPVQWQYVKDSDGHIIGRFAYAVIGQNLMNLNSVARHTWCRMGSACDGSSCTDYSKRLGNSPAELEFRSNLFTFNNGTLNRAAVNTGTSYGASPFQNIQDLLVGLGNSTTITGSKESPAVRLSRYFNVTSASSLNEPDAWFAGDADSDNQKDKSEYYQRFPLRRTDWDSLTVASIRNPAVLFYDGELPRSTNTTGIPWLTNWSDTDGHWPDGETKGNQIIANLLNYCSSESRAVVSDVDPASWSAAAVPTYTGNKRTKYLNECSVRVSAQGNMGASTTHNVQISETETMTWYSWDSLQLELRIGINPEIVKMYESVLGTEYKVKLLGTVSFQYQTNNYSDIGTTSPGFSLTTPVMNTKDYTLNSGDYDCRELGSEPYKYFCFVKTADISDPGKTEIVETIDVGRFASSSASPSESDKNALFRITDLKVNFNMMLVKDGDNVDYACLPFPDTAAPVVAVSASELTELASWHYSADDPRHNLHEADWHEADPTLGAVNNFSVSCSYSPESVCARDPETVSDPAWYGTGADQHISTAYIRHGPMESLWELGAIHRAAPWQTLNFKRSNAAGTNASLDSSLSAGGGAYKDGDFLLADQVSTTGWSSSNAYITEEPFGKINLNAVQSESRKFNFDALFRNMPFSTDGRYTREAATPITGETDGWITPSGWLGNLTTPIYRRSDLWKSSSDEFWKLCTESPISGDSLNTDALQEQLLCRMINLTKAVTNCDSAIVVAIAQTIQDIGNNAEIYTDWNEDGTTDETESGDDALVKAGYKKYDKTNPAAFPAKSNVPGHVTATFGHYDLGADRITGEAKLQAYLLYDRSLRRWKLVQVKYEE